MANVPFLRNPRTLYKLCIECFKKGFTVKVKNNEPIPSDVIYLQPSLETAWLLEFMPASIVVNIFTELSAKSQRLRKIMIELLGNLNTLANLLAYAPVVDTLILCFTLAKYHIPLYINSLPEKYLEQFSRARSRRAYGALITFGLRLSSFLTEIGWTVEAVQILTHVLTKATLMEEPLCNLTDVQLDCLQRRLHCETMIWEFEAGARTLSEISKILAKTEYQGVSSCLIVDTYTRAAAFELARHKYDAAHGYSVYAMKCLRSSMRKTTVVDTLRTTAKTCMAIREYEPACILIKQALSIAANVFGCEHLKYAEVMFDYAYFLLIFDRVPHAVEAYSEVFDIRLDHLSYDSFLSCLTLVACTNARYLQRDGVLKMIDRAYSKLSKMLPENNLLLAAAYRLRTLIRDKVPFNKYSLYYWSNRASFSRFLASQIDTVNLCVDIQGEMNLYTARNYFELARLYQAAKLYQDAKRSIAKCVWITRSEKRCTPRDAYDLRVLEDYLTKGDEELDILLNIQCEPWLLNRIESSDRVLEEEYVACPRCYEGLRNLYPPEDEFYKHLMTLAAETGRTSVPSIHDFCCIDYLRDRYFPEA